MPGFLLQDDAIAERKRKFDEWITEQQQNLQQTLAPPTPPPPAAPAPVTPEVPAPAPAPVEDPQVEQRRARFQSWVDQQQQAAVPTLAQPAPAAPTPLEQRAESPEVEQRRQRFQAWVDQQQPGGQPAPVPATPAEQTVVAQHEPSPPLQTAGTQVANTPNANGQIFPLAVKSSNAPSATYHGQGGTDLMAPRGTPVLNMQSGRVDDVFTDNGSHTVGGNAVLIHGDDGLDYYYAHFDQPTALKPGQRVMPGEQIGAVGNSGNAWKDGQGETHLHIGIGRGISNGVGAEGGLGQNFNAQALLTELQSGIGQASTTGVPVQTTAGLSGGGDLAGQVGERGQQILAGAAQAADWLGTEGQKALQAVLVTEGGLSGARGDQGKSAGPLQFFGEEGGRGGQLNAFAQALGMSLEQARQYATDHPLEAVQWAVGSLLVPGYLGSIIGQGVAQGLTGPALATYVQQHGQVSVSPERAGEVWQRLFGGGQGPTTAAPAPSGEPSLLSRVGQAGVQQVSDLAAQGRAGAERLAGQTSSALQAAQAQSQQLMADLDRSRSDFARQGEQYRSGLMGQMDQTRADIMAPRQLPGVQDLAESGLGQAALRAPLPPLGGQSIGGLVQAAQQAPENVGRLAGALEPTGQEARRQVSEGIVSQAAVEPARAVLRAGGRELSPEAEEFLRSLGGGPIAAGAQADPGGLAATFLKSSGMAPPEMTVPLPGLGDVPIANLVGLGVNMLLPTGAEERFGTGALRTGLTETSRLGRPVQQWGAAAAVEQGLGRAGRAVLDQATTSRMAVSAIGRWARSSTEDIAQDLARSPVGELLRSESGELNIDALMGAAGEIKQQMVRMYHGTGAAFDRPSPEHFDPNGRYGPAYYLADTPGATGAYAEARAAEGAAGANIRPVDVPRDLRLLDMDAPLPAEAKAALSAGFGGEQPGPVRFALNKEWAHDTYTALQRAGVSATDINRTLADAGFDGVRYQGGFLTGDEVAHQATGIFPESLDKIRNAISGRQGGQADPRLALNLAGATAGAGSQEATMTEEEKANPFVRVSRDLSGALLGGVAPNLAISGARGIAATARGRTPSLDELSQIRQTLGGAQLSIPGTGGQRMTPAELISAVGKQNLLFGAKQNVQNIVSQMAELVRTPARAALAGQGDQALLAMRAGVHGIPDALSTFARSFRSGISTTAAPGQRTQAWLPVFRLLGATDDMFRVLGAHMGMATEAQRLVNEAGAKTPQEIAQVLQQNQQRIFNSGKREGAASVFQTLGMQGASDTMSSFGKWKNGLLGSVAQSPQWQEHLKAYGKQGLGLLVDAIVPFAGMPGRLFDIGIGRLPVVGEARRFGELGMALKRGDRAGAQRALGELGMQSVLSSVILTNTFAGNIRGPDDPDHPNSVLVGGNWVDYSGWGAFQLPLAMPAAAVDEWRKTGNRMGGDDRAYLTAVMGAWGKTLSNAYYLNSVFDTATAIGQGGLPGALSKTLTSYTDRAMPSGFNQVEQMIDENVREVSKEFPQSVVDRWKSRVPYLAETLPAQVEPTTGGAKAREKQGPVGTLLGVETYQQAPIEKEIYRLNRLGYALRPPSANPQTISVNGAQIRLQPDEQRALGQARGQQLERVVGARMGSSYWGTLTDDQRARLIARALDQASEHNVVTWRRMTPIPEQRERIARGQQVVGRLTEQGQFGGGGFTAPSTAA